MRGGHRHAVAPRRTSVMAKSTAQGASYEQPVGWAARRVAQETTRELEATQASHAAARSRTRGACIVGGTGGAAFGGGDAVCGERSGMGGGDLGPHRLLIAIVSKNSPLAPFRRTLAAFNVNPPTRSLEAWDPLQRRGQRGPHLLSAPCVLEDSDPSRCWTAPASSSSALRLSFPVS